MVTVATAGNWPEDELSLDLVGWKDSACGDLYTSFFFHYKITALMREWLFPSSPCSAFFCHDFL